MPSSTDDVSTIRILLATDNHVGYNERDPIRGDDSWKSFHEVMCLAKERDVDMVLLSGDLFHDNIPSRKSMFQVMRSLRLNCYGEKPCELEVLSDVSTNLQGAFNHVNYEDPDINVAIPVFSIHGNHDDPSGEGRYCALDILQCAGLLNYFGRTPENDNIVISPILLQKGETKLALYGLSNIRDERLFRTFRDGKVKFLRPATQMNEWFNLMTVHQNHQAHTETGYLPENFLQEFLDLVVWGHEHECIIEPRVNTDMGFSVVQPGSSVATSLCVGESVAKKVGILTINRKEFKIEPVPLKTVRPFLMKEISLASDKNMLKISKKKDNRSEVTRYLTDIVDQMIKEAEQEWLEQQGNDLEEDQKTPLPLIRLRVEHSAPDGGSFDTENPQRFSNRFVGRVANVSDVVQFHRKKSGQTRNTNATEDHSKAEVMLEEMRRSDNIKVEELVREFLSAQSLNILPQNGLGNAISQFIDKGDLHAVETFVSESLKTQFNKVKGYQIASEDDIDKAMRVAKAELETVWEKSKSRLLESQRKKKPDDWDTDMDGEFRLSDVDEDEEGVNGFNSTGVSESEPSMPSRAKTTTKGSTRTSRATTTKATTTKAKAAPKKAPAKAATKARGKKKALTSDEEEPEEEEDENEEDDDDIVVLEDDLDSDVQMIDDSAAEEVMPKKTTTRGGRTTKAAPKPAPKKAALAKKTAPAKKTTSTRQSKIDFSQPKTRSRKPPSDDEIEDDDEEDDFRPMGTQRARR